MKTNGTHGPNPGNELHPYFPDEMVARCRKDVLFVLSRFPDLIIKKLAMALRNRRVDGSFAKSDLLGTLARLQSGKRSYKQRRRHMYEKELKREPGMHNDFEYWFFQIAGRPSLRGHTKDHRCIFTETTIGWCVKLLADRARGTRQ